MQGIGPAHFFADQVLEGADLGFRDFQQELVVHLQDEARASALVAEAAVDRDHRPLDDVRVGALHDEVHGELFAE